MTKLAAHWNHEKPLHLIVLVEDGVNLYSADVMSQRTASVWLPDQQVTLRLLRRGTRPLEPSHAAWWDVVLNDDQAQNVAIGWRYRLPTVTCSLPASTDIP